MRCLNGFLNTFDLKPVSQKNDYFSDYDEWTSMKDVLFSP